MKNRYGSTGYIIPLSVYCLATSATASPIFFRTSVTDSLVKQVINFWRMINRCSPVSVEKSSLASFVTGSFLVLVAILRKSTAEKVRVCCQIAIRTGTKDIANRGGYSVLSVEMRKYSLPLSRLGSADGNLLLHPPRPQSARPSP